MNVMGFRCFLSCLVFLAFGISSFNAIGDSVASVKAYCLSVDLQPATANNNGVPLKAYFTTYDGNSGLPLFDLIGNTIYFSGELSPLSGNPGWYVTDYGVMAYGSWSAYGTASATFPVIDADQNGVPDFLQTELPSNVSFTGTAMDQGPSSVVYSMSGRLSRQAGSRLGSYIAVLSSGNLTITYSGTTHLVNAIGSLTYRRGTPNQCMFQVNLTDSDGNVDSYTGPSSYTVASADQIQLPETTFASPTGKRVITRSCLLTRNKTQYRGKMEMVDGNPLTSWSDYKQWVVVIDDPTDSDGNGVPDLSDSLAVPPTITAQPQTQTVTEGQSVSFTVSATGAAPFTYQWSKNGTAIPGATGSSYIISHVSTTDGGSYAVSVKNSAGKANSQVALLVVNPLPKPPTITQQPISQSVEAGGDATFSVVAVASGTFSYQWRKDGVNIPGATGAVLKLQSVTANDSGRYSVVVGNQAGSSVSSEASLTVTIKVIVRPVFSTPRWSQSGGGSVTRGFSALLQVQPQTVYRIQFSTNLVNWFDLTTFRASGVLIQIVDQDATNAPKRFYRAVVENSGNTNQPPKNLDPAHLVWIPPGTFTMGSPSGEEDGHASERPQTVVTLTKGYWMGRQEVTQGEYLALIGSNPSFFNGVRQNYPQRGTNTDFGIDTSRPVETVTWYDATNYCGQLTQHERAAGRLPSGYEYRLPTEAQWEYACRAGTTTRFSYGDDPGYSQLGNYAWYDVNSGGATHSGGRKLPNPWGLYDMHGNVWEWCQDWFGDYAGGIALDPQGPAAGPRRVVRGGGWGLWDANAGYCRSADRFDGGPGNWGRLIGFRVVLAPGQP